MTRSVRLMLLGVVLSGLACGDGGGPDADPGLVGVELTTPYQDDGAILFQVRGGSVKGVTPAAGFEATYAALPGGVTSVLVRGPLANGVIVQLELPDRRRVARYSVTVLQGAARGYARRPSASYAVRLLPP